MFHVIPVTGSSFSATTPLGAKSVQYIYFEDKSGHLRNTKSDVATISIAIDGRQVCRDLLIIPFCTCTLMGSNNKFPWQKVALETNLNCNMSEIIIRTNAEPNSLNIVMVCSDKEVDESRGFDFYETKRMVLKSSVTTSTVKNSIGAALDYEKEKLLNVWEKNPEAKQYALGQYWINMAGDANAIRQGSEFYNLLMAEVPVGETIESKFGRNWDYATTMKYSKDNLYFRVGQHHNDADRWDNVGGIKVEGDWEKTWNALKICLDAFREKYPDLKEYKGKTGFTAEGYGGSTENWDRANEKYMDDNNSNNFYCVFSNATEAKIDEVMFDFNVEVNGIKFDMKTTASDAVIIDSKADEIAEKINSTFIIPESEINYSLDKEPQKVFCCMIAEANDDTNDGYSMRLNSYLPLELTLGGGDQEILPKGMALQLLCCNDNVPMADVVWNFDKADGLTRNVIAKLDKADGFGTDEEVVNKKFYHQFKAFANATLYLLFGYKKLV